MTVYPLAQVADALEKAAQFPSFRFQQDAIESMAASVRAAEHAAQVRGLEVDGGFGDEVGGYLAAVRAELAEAVIRFPPIHSPHEGYAVILEELDELWQLVRRNVGREPEARAEAVQVAAMAVRYLLDLVPGEAEA